MYDLLLDDHISESIHGQAKQRGLSDLELIRWILGSWTIGELQQVPRYIPSLDAIPTTPGADSVEMLGKSVQFAVAAQGNLSCRECTQRLTMKDVRAGVCGKCESPID